MFGMGSAFFLRSKLIRKDLRTRLHPLREYVGRRSGFHAADLIGARWPA